MRGCGGALRKGAVQKKRSASENHAYGLGGIYGYLLAQFTNLFRIKCRILQQLRLLMCIYGLLPAHAIEPIRLERLSVTVIMSYGDEENS